jgi:hypothetical protein
MFLRFFKSAEKEGDCKVQGRAVTKLFTMILFGATSWTDLNVSIKPFIYTLKCHRFHG